MILPRRFAVLSSLPLLAALLLGTIAAVPAWPTIPALLLLYGLPNILVLAVCFRRDPAVRAMRSLACREKEQVRRLKSINREVRRWERRRTRLNARYDELRATLSEKKNHLADGESRARERALSAIDELLQDLESARHEVDRQERDALDAALGAMQDRHVRDCLRRSYLLSASIPDLSRYSKLRLWIMGIRSAADVSSDRTSALKRLEREQVVAVLAWQASIRAHAKRTRPRRLPAGREDRVTAKYRRRRNRLWRDVKRLTVRQRFIAEVLSGLHEARRAALDRKLEDARELYLEAGRQLDITIARVREDEPLHHRQLAQLRGELGLSGRLTFCRYLSAVIGR